MNQYISDKILHKIKSKGRGWVFTVKDFLDIGARNTVDQVLLRLTHKTIIRKLATGIYDYPVQHKVLGQIAPSSDAIARALAVQSGSSLYPSGAACANLLGLTTQVPAKTVYLTSSIAKSKMIGSSKIQLKRSKYACLTSSEKVYTVLAALLHIGKGYIDGNALNKCSAYLTNKDKKELHSITPKLPAWVIPSVNQISIQNG